MNTWAPRCPDIVLARRHLGWRPMTGLKDGLRRTVADFALRVVGT
ncbi:hypothetical protein ABRY95_10385 [Castellaniella ginsengisoli]|uniref:NAD-dependent dehydratase n=1 Tax=Castellaniella ginsengisoli TaxID=546114 RepID=A0AB39EZY7_9BURK